MRRGDTEILLASLAKLCEREQHGEQGGRTHETQDIRQAAGRRTAGRHGAHDHRARGAQPIRSRSASSMSARSRTTAGPTRHDVGRKAVEAELGDKVKTSFVENVPEGPGRRARDPPAREQGQQADLHHLVRLHEPDAEGREALPEREVRARHRLQARANVAPTTPASTRAAPCRARSPAICPSPASSAISARSRSRKW